MTEKHSGWGKFVEAKTQLRVRKCYLIPENCFRNYLCVQRTHLWTSMDLPRRRDLPLTTAEELCARACSGLGQQSKHKGFISLRIEERLSFTTDLWNGEEG